MQIELENVTLDYEILGGASKLLTKSLMQLATAGKISGKGDRRSVRALNGVSLSIKANDRLAIIGGNGAGKTTLLKVMAGIYTASTGKVKIKGKVTPILGSGFGLDEESTGYENILLGGIALGFSKKQMLRRVSDIEDFSELGEFLNMPLRTYSAGMRARLAFAITTSFQPEILVMDEGIGAGDATFFHKAEKRLRSFYNKAQILILASHSTELLKSLCNKAIVMKNGNILFSGDVKDAVAYYESKEYEEFSPA